MPELQHWTAQMSRIIYLMGNDVGVRHEVAIIIVMRFRDEDDMTGRSVGRSLPVRAGLATTRFEATGTMPPAQGPIPSRETRDHLRASMRVGG